MVFKNLTRTSASKNIKYAANAVSFLPQITPLFFVLFVFGVSSPTLYAAPSEDIRGIWIDHREAGKQKVAVLIEDCNGTLCGRIYWMKKPLRDGRPKTDMRNPDPALRERPLCGLRILNGFKRSEDNTWGNGQIYSPSDGNTFSSTIHLEKEGSIKIRGYIGISLFGKTLEWVRPSEKLEPCV
ncbi:MAG: DUF2147 domain-containing protein [Burkholderiaceae bacterium]|nr:DUF2147 domain-containing protein [Burkholderiaceae bacterium]